MFEVGKLYKDVNGGLWAIKAHDADGLYFRAEGKVRETGVTVELNFSSDGRCVGSPCYNLVAQAASEAPHESGLVKSSGGPTTYYDYDPSWVTHNDYLEAKASQWGVHSWHLSNISKVLTRWGCKDGADISYDAKKGLYSFCRVFAVIAGKGALRKYLQELLDDPQFKD
jgi:hypothetical protein